nr:MAG TPA: hypothetical protein [Inoviridae sp.]
MLFSNKSVPIDCRGGTTKVHDRNHRRCLWISLKAVAL